MTDNYDNKQKSKAGYLKYKTIGQITPQGLPKILFACHPKEFERYFETVWQWLREGRNVALFRLRQGTVNAKKEGNDP